MTGPKKTAYELWWNYKPDVSNMRICGCRIVSKWTGDSRNKISPNGEEGHFIGYSHIGNGYLILKRNRQVVTRREVSFFEDLTKPHKLNLSDAHEYEIRSQIIKRATEEEVEVTDRNGEANCDVDDEDEDAPLQDAATTIRARAGRGILIRARYCASAAYARCYACPFTEALWPTSSLK